MGAGTGGSPLGRARRAEGFPGKSWISDALEGGVGPAGLGAVPEDALDEAGGPGFPFVSGFAGVAQAGVQLRAIPGVDVSVGHGLGGAAVCWGGKKTWNHNRELRQPLAVLGNSPLLIPGSVQGWVGRGLEQPGIEEGVPARGSTWNEVIPKFPSNPNLSMML